MLDTTSNVINTRVQGVCSEPERFFSVADDDAAEAPLRLSIVIPVYNEADSLEQLHDRISNALDSIDGVTEVIYIDDGSTDSSAAILERLCRRDDRTCLIRFRRNFGQTAAFSAGFAQARGEIIVTLDADLQNDPADIPQLLTKMTEGYDIVSGWRANRQDTFLTRRLPSQIANRLISYMTGVRLHDYGCSLKAYRHEVIQNINLYGELHRFIPALASWMGVRVAEVPVNHYARQFGTSKYGLWRTVRVILDLITVKFLLDYGTRPAHVFGLLGVICFVGGTGLAGYLTILRLFFNEGLADRPLLLLAILLIVLGVQLLTMGLIGEMLVRAYYEIQRKPIYAIREVVTARSLPTERNSH